MHENCGSLPSETYSEATIPCLWKNALCSAPIYGDAMLRRTWNFSSMHSLPKQHSIDKSAQKINCWRQQALLLVKPLKRSVIKGETRKKMPRSFGALSHRANIVWPLTKPQMEYKYVCAYITNIWATKTKKKITINWNINCSVSSLQITLIGKAKDASKTDDDTKAPARFAPCFRG